MPETAVYSVMVVDDSPEQIRYISEILKAEGCRIYAATSCEAAFKILEHSLPNLIILDIVMPDMDGFEMCRRLKADQTTEDIPVMFATAYHDSDYIGEGFAAGGCDYLVKPFIREELLERVKVRIRLSRKRIELQEAYAELDKFCYTLSHDIRAPLYVIRQLAELLKNEVSGGDPEEAVKISNMILEKATGAANMTDGLHHFSKALYETVDKTKVDMDTIFEEVYEELSMLEENREIQFEKKVLPSLMGDSVLVRLVIQNVLSNALKFTRTCEVARISVSFRKTHDCVKYGITDNGIGMKQTESEDVFQIFRRLHSPEEYEGEGIGLATVKRIMFRHGGNVKIESEPGKGTSVWLIFPSDV
ncbi:response regulator [Hespellia stercorisuis]|uniref:Stage 0 sporulation protein A homolog n=1 Tax=Hespellia stercorisuis DSM 15480 TaxID=1121950 RepID=A0A1M6JZS7_9FIRM|nr:response regulator [Hespellia stercorisuis]SHJ52144.1 Histidine kinase-, DNA gyrase B-, and HSP90-like ATPase [Hespellia stercorisuis DSM 15480]